MKKSVFAFFISGCIGISLAQTSQKRVEKDYKNYPHWIEMMQDPQANFFETQKAFYTYWKGRKIEKGGGYKPFKRWEHFMAQQVDEKGNKPQGYQILNELQNTPTVVANSAPSSQSAWQEVGPVQLPANGTGQPNGLGRINAIGFHPTDANTFYAGAPAGGLWKTTDGGSTWSSNTDNLATLGVSAIVVDHTNPDVVYFGSGDRDASDAPGLGVYKSTDGGATWALSNSGMGNRTVGELVMDPSNNNILIAATNGGVYRSTNGGSSWSQSISGNFKDLKLHPTNSSIIYAASGGNLYKSTNNGASFSLSMTGIPSGKSRLAIGVSPDEPNTVYVLAAQGSVYGGLFKSTNSGTNFSTMSTTPNIMDYSTNGSGTSGQAWYDMCIAVNPTNASEVYVGGVNIFKSSNSGATWTINAHWVGSGGASAIHADQHILRYSPAGKLYVGNDGGVYHKGTSNETWTDISSGLAISQCYKIGQSQTDVDRVIVGYQDNGTGIYDNGNWRTEIGGDGMESVIDYTNSAYMYGELYYGAIRRSTNNGYSFSNIAGNGVNGITESGAWVTPYVLHEQDPNTMFIGYRDIWRSTNVKASSSGSVSWTEISSNLGGSGTFSFLEHNEANGDILYASKGSALFRSDNVMASSVVWTTLSSPGSGSILSIETSELDENVVYLTQGSKIYKSTNKGSSWTDITSNLNNSQYKTSLVYAPMAIGRGLYVATDYGVFFKPENETDWITYSTGLPNYAKIKEIEIFEDNSGNHNHKIRAASYGRGLWSNDIYQTGEVVSVDLTATSICLGNSATIVASNANSYFWTDPNGTVVGNSATLTVSPTQTTVYTVNGIMANGDTTQANSTVNVLDPSVSIAGQTTLCSGASTTLTATVSGTGSYSYLWSNGATTQSIQVSPSSNTSYSVTATSTEGCTASASHQINMVGAADFLVVEVKTDNYPLETSWTLAGTSGNVYQTFQQGGYTNSNTVYIDTIFCVTDSCLVFTMSDSYGDGICCSYGQGYYKIFQSDGTLLADGGAFSSSTTSNFCIQSTTPPPFVLTVTDSILNACQGDLVTFTANGADTYSWQDNSGLELSTSNTLTVNAQNNTTYTVYGYSNGDTLSENVTLNVEDVVVSVTGNTEACEGESMTLTASGASSYVWSDGSTGSSITVNNATAGASSSTVWVIGQDNGCSSDTVATTLSWSANPVVSISGNSAICEGGNVTLTASGADTYVWSNGATSSSITLSPAATTTITVQGFLNGCSSDLVSETVVVNSNPLVTVSGDTEVCEGESITLTASGADSYLWSDGSTGNTYTATPASSMVVTVQGTTNGCTSDVVSESITVLSNPVIAVSGNSPVCEGENITLTASGADTYLWSNGSTGSTITLSPLTSTAISVQGFTNGCSSNTVTESITVNPTPTVSISGGTTVCLGEDITLTASGADSYVWSDGSTGNSVTLTPSANTTVTVQGSTNGCTSDVISHTVTVNTTTQVTLSGNTTVCEGESTTLTAFGADSYVWSDGSTGNTLTITPDVTTSITVQGFTAGCGSDMISETITVNANPVVTISGDSAICEGESVTLTANGADTYVWSDGSTGNTITLSPLAATTVSVQGTTNGCSSDLASHTVMVNANPVVSISGNTTVCEGDSITLVASGADSYVWSDGSTGNSISLTPTSATTVSVQGFSNGCESDIVSETITVNANPIVTISGNAAICLGESITLVATGADSYVWSDGSTGNSLTINPTSTTTVSVQGFTNGCASDIVSETVVANPNPTVTISGNTDVCLGESVTLTASGADTYMWSDGSTGNSITLSPTAATTVTVQGFVNGCASDLVSESIVVNTAPVISLTGTTELCSGESTTLTVSGADSYVWSDGSTGNSLTLTPDSSTTVSVQGFSNGCASDLVSQSITVNSANAVEIMGDTEACLGDTITLNAVGGGSYLWSTGETTSSIQVVATGNTTVSVTSTQNGCTSTDDINLTVTSAPVVEITGNTEACIGESVTLTASGADTYLWSTGETTESITFTVNDSMTVSVTGTTGGCASSTESIEITPSTSSSYFVVEIKTDWYGYETTWSLEDDLGNVVASHSNADGSYSNNTYYRDTVYCATVGSCYTFTINDSYGDGICCSYGDGHYLITQSDGSILAQGGNFDYTETQDFCIGEPQTEISLELSDYELEVCKKETFSITASGAASYVWTNEDGDVVGTGETLTTQISQTTTFTVTGTTGSLTGTETVTVEVAETNEITIIIKTDWYGYETSWKLKDSSGDVVASRSAYSYKNNKKYKHKIKCLPDECYTLEVYDSYGDGMCCAYGYGYFKVKGPNGVVLANGGQFGYQTTEEFCFGGAAVPKLPYEDMDNEITDFVAKTAPNAGDLSSLDNIVVYPNPTYGELNIDAEGSDFFIDRYVITDLSGRILLDESFDKPFKTKQVNTSSFTEGQYFVKLFAGNQIKIIKVIKE